MIACGAEPGAERCVNNPEEAPPIRRWSRGSLPGSQPGGRWFKSSLRDSRGSRTVNAAAQEAVTVKAGRRVTRAVAPGRLPTLQVRLLPLRLGRLPVRSTWRKQLHHPLRRPQQPMCERGRLGVILAAPVLLAVTSFG